jgi:hypothetical protein
MVNNAEVVVGILGIAGSGLALGYLAANTFKPKITISPNPVTPGALVTFEYSGFPPFTGLVSMGGGTNGIASGPVTIGSTDQNGNLQIVGPAPTNIPSGTKILYVAFDAANPEIFATAIYIGA